MKTRIIKGWRTYTTDEFQGREREPQWDFTELIKAMRHWYS